MRHCLYDLFIRVACPGGSDDLVYGHVGALGRLLLRFSLTLLLKIHNFG